MSPHRDERDNMGIPSNDRREGWNTTAWGIKGGEEADGGERGCFLDVVALGAPAFWSSWQQSSTAESKHSTIGPFSLHLAVATPWTMVQKTDQRWPTH